MTPILRAGKLLVRLPVTTVLEAKTASGPFKCGPNTAYNPWERFGEKDLDHIWGVGSLIGECREQHSDVRHQLSS